MAKAKQPDDLDGLCDPDLQPTPIEDDEISGVVLYADVADIEKVAARKREWEELFGGHHDR